MKQRGYNLVEMMIALVVLGLLLGSALVPLQARYQTENRKDAEQAMADAREAVQGYAVINRTVARRVIAPPDNINYALPAGRPYLPCPDITGDGLENRHGITVAAQIVTLAATLTLAGGRNVLEVEGACEQQKGLLPWRTLGLQEGADPWGRRLGYWVDAAFSNEILGFDETFRADMFDPRLGLEAAAPSAAGTTLTLLYQERRSRHISGALVCSRITVGGGCPAVGDQNFMVAGIVTGDRELHLDEGDIGDINVRRIVPEYTSANGADPPQGILDGAAFVVFSHGPNGHGAIARHARVGGTPATGGCLTMPSDAHGLGERANAFYRTGHPFLDDPFNCAPIAHNELAENLFFSAPQSNLDGGPDDIVAWTSPNMLVGLMLRSGALPVPKLPFLPGAGR